jgi:uncharacterized membrane protein (UPF0127 family)
VRRVLGLALLLLAAPVAAQPITYAKDTVTIETASGQKHRFNVELATTPPQIAQGLMFRRQMAPDSGMLFIFERPDPATFWMKNTYIPLDMIFIGPDGRILNIAERTIPLTETPVPAAGPTRAVLEVNGGTSSRLGIKPGDRVRHSSLP